MAKQRYINTKFWDDTYIVDLDPIEKLLFLYFLTNPLTNICGIYEIPLRRIAFDTGIDKEMILKIVNRFSLENKIFYIDGWIYIRNFAKHQKLNDSISKGIENSLKTIPVSILLKVSEIETSTPQTGDRLVTDCDLSKYKYKPKPESKSKINIPFDQFWNLYKKKVGNKIKLEKKWNNLKDEERQAIIEYLPKYTQATPDVVFRKNPETFLNNRSWEDEIINLSSKRIPTDEEIKKREALRIKREEDEKKKLDEISSPRTPEEQARINKKLADMREKLTKKLSNK